MQRLFLKVVAVRGRSEDGELDVVLGGEAGWGREGHDRRDLKPCDLAQPFPRHL